MIGVVSCTPAGARTLDTLIKSQVLYQLSYKRMPDFRIAGAKVRTFFDTTKCFSVFFQKTPYFFCFTLFYIYISLKKRHIFGIFANNDYLCTRKKYK